MRCLICNLILILSVYAAYAQEQPYADTTQLFTDTASLQPAQVFDTLIGTLPPIVRNRNHPYIVPSNIEVPPDRTVTIEPGTVLLFKNFAGLHIRGRLIALGKPDKQIVFSSEFDNSYNAGAAQDANPFDWDGIYFTIDALGSQMSYCRISYSVYCIASESKYIRLDPLFVNDNGKNVITIDNVGYPLNDTLFTYKLDISDSYKDGIPIKLFTDPVAKKRNSLRIIGSALAAIGIGGGIYFASELSKSKDKLDNLHQTDFENLNIHTNRDWVNTENEIKKDKWMITGSSLLFIAGAYFITWSFTF